jgi:hypothetical protein
MNRTRIVIALGVILAISLLVAFTRTKRPANTPGQAGTVTIAPKDFTFTGPKMTVIANLPATNITNKSSPSGTERR